MGRRYRKTFGAIQFLFEMRNDQAYSATSSLTPAKAMGQPHFRFGDMCPPRLEVVGHGYEIDRLTIAQQLDQWGDMVGTIYD